MTFRTRVLAASLAFVAGFVPFAIADDRTFVDVVGSRFEQWDTDKNGELSTAELDSLTTDPRITGEEAATVASIKLTIRSGKYELPKVLTRDYLISQKDNARPVQATPVDTDREDDADLLRTSPINGAPSEPLKAPQFRAKYLSAVKKIKSTPRELFGDETPDLDQAHQGPLGDCFFVSVVGACVERDSQAVKKMITPKEGGGYTVAFGNGKVQEVTPLTDVELAISSRVGNEGLWICVLEKAFGQLRMESKPEAQRTEQSIDAISKGGSVATSIKTLTGHDVDSVTMRAKAEKAADAEALAPLLAQVRKTLKGALDAKRLAAAGTGSTDKVPPGMSPKHAYAVLAYDEATDTVKIWNPHGNTFKPKGDAGIQNGYPTKAGRFEMPLVEFVKVFRATTVETDRPIPAGGRSRGPRKQ